LPGIPAPLRVPAQAPPRRWPKVKVPPSCPEVYGRPRDSLRDSGHAHMCQQSPTGAASRATCSAVPPPSPRGPLNPAPSHLRQFRNLCGPKAHTQVAFSSRKSHYSQPSKGLRVFRNCSKSPTSGIYRLFL
jgi:hypothetical protein